MVVAKGDSVVPSFSTSFPRRREPKSAPQRYPTQYRRNQGTSDFLPLFLVLTSATALSIAAIRWVVEGWLAV